MSQGEDIRSLLDQGLTYYGLGEVRRALDTWKKVLEAEPGNPRAVEYIRFVEENWAPNQDRDDGSYRPDEESNPAGKTIEQVDSTPESGVDDSYFSSPPTSELEAPVNPEAGEQEAGQADLAPGEVPIADDSGFVAPVQPIVESNQWGDLYGFSSSGSKNQAAAPPPAPPVEANSIEETQISEPTDSTTSAPATAAPATQTPAAPAARSEKEPLSLSLEATSDLDLGEIAAALDDIAGVQLSGEASEDSQAGQVEQAEWNGLAWSKQVGTSPVVVTSAMKEKIRAEAAGSTEVPAANPTSAPTPELLETIQSSTLPAAPTFSAETPSTKTPPSETPSIPAVEAAPEATPAPAENVDEWGGAGAAEVFDSATRQYQSPPEPTPAETPPVETPATPEAEAAPETTPAPAENMDEWDDAGAAGVFDSSTRQYQSVPAAVAVREAEQARETAAQESAGENIRLNPVAPFSLESSSPPVEAPVEPSVEAPTEPPVVELLNQAAAGAPVDADSPWSAPPPIGLAPGDSSSPRFAVGLTPNDAGASALGLVANEEVEPAIQAKAVVGTGAESLMAGAMDLLELDDFSGAIELLDKVLEEDPNHVKATKLREGAAAKLTKIYLSKLGDLELVPEVRMAGDEIIWLNLDHRAGFVLSLVDSHTSFEDILSVSGLPTIEGLKILVQLVNEKVIVIA